MSKARRNERPPAGHLPVEELGRALRPLNPHVLLEIVKNQDKEISE